ncbi:MAG: MFS transporter, partial [Maritimibacter sp.]
MANRTLTLEEAQSLPRWRQPVALLMLMATAMPLAFSTWSALLNNFVIEAGGFTGVEIGWLHTLREIPGFLAIGVIVLIMFLREQLLAVIALALLAASTAVTAWFPSLAGILTITMLSSLGFHYYETVNQSLQLQWIARARAPQLLGWLVAIGSGASLLAYGLLVATWKSFDLSYNFVYLTAGGISLALVL